MARSPSGRSAPRLSDEELEYYAELYIRTRVRNAGVEFESFLNNPEYYLRKYAAEHLLGDRQDGKGLGKSLRSFLRLRQRARMPGG